MRASSGSSAPAHSAASRPAPAPATQARFLGGSDRPAPSSVLLVFELFAGGKGDDMEAIELSQINPPEQPRAPGAGSNQRKMAPRQLPKASSTCAINDRGRGQKTAWVECDENGVDLLYQELQRNTGRCFASARQVQRLGSLLEDPCPNVGCRFREKALWGHLLCSPYEIVPYG